MSIRRLHRGIAALAATASLGAGAGTYSDLWFNPQEPGWGVQVVQQVETAFVTLFVYGPDGKPTWYVASDARIVAYGSPGPVFRGTLYRTRGPWHGGPFDPAAVTVTAVGEVWLEALARDRMRLHYTAEGVGVVKELTRQTWQEAEVVGHYMAQFALRQSRPGEPPFGTRIYPAQVMFYFHEGQGLLRVDDDLGRRCEYRGPYAQAGKLTRFSGSFTCSPGDPAAGTFEVTEMEVSNQAITGVMRTSSPGTLESGRFAAVRY